VKRGIERRLDSQRADIEKAEQRLRDLEFMGDRAAKEFAELSERKARAVDVARLTSGLKGLYMESGVLLLDLFFDGPLSVVEIEDAMVWVERMIQGLEQTRDYARKLAAGETPPMPDSLFDDLVHVVPANRTHTVNSRDYTTI
jgi:hypothetical protein